MAPNRSASPAAALRRARAALSGRPDLWAVLALAGLGLALRLAFSTRAPVLVTKDSFEYFAPAFNLANGLGFDLALRRPPVYSLFAAGVMGLLGQNLAAIAFAQHLLGVGTVVLTYWLGRLCFGRLAGLLAGLLVATSSVLILHEHYILSEPVFTFMLVGTVTLFVLALRRDRAGWYLLAGLAFGLTVLARPIAQAVLLAVPVALLAHRRGIRAALAPTALVLLGAALLILPWMVRNRLVYGSFSTSGSGRFLSARVVRHDRGYQFYDPASARQLGPLGQRARQIFQAEADARPEEGPIYSRYRSELGLSEAEADELLRQIALEGIGRAPLHYAQTTVAMFLDIFAGDQKEELLRWHLRERSQERVMNQWEGTRHLLGPPTAAQQDEAATAEALGSIYRPSRWLTPLVVGMLLAVALGLWRAADAPALFLGAVIGLTLAVSAALVGEVPRYRYPLDPLICVLAVGGYLASAGLLLERWGGRRSRARRVAPGGAAVR